MNIKPKRLTSWAEGSIIYQIYPRSFQDSNSDGIGDLAGIITRLDYLKWLGISGIWLSPFYKSPMADFGYDVADYEAIDPIFGKMADFDRLLKQAHKRNIKVIIDIVPNHTSDEHKWFQASKSSRTNAYSDWYVWRDPIEIKDNEPVPPNNWLDMFSGGSAWEWVQERQQFYLHSFHVKQPDLNWENPKVREAIANVLRFWLNKGVDGFRVDAVPFLAKNPMFKDDGLNPDFVAGKSRPSSAVLRDNSAYWPAHFGYLGELADVLTEKPYKNKPRFMVTEGYPSHKDTVSDYIRYFENMDPTVAGPFIFEAIYTPWRANTWRDFLSNLNKEIDLSVPNGVPSYAFGNHDQSRIVSRLDIERARAAAVIEFTLPGSVYIYNGDEIGMHDVHIPKELIQDPGATGSEGRDPERTPMQWGDKGTKNSGFSEADITWLPLAEDAVTNNVETQKHQPDSFLNLYKNLIHLRRFNKAFSHGKIEFDLHNPKDVLAYTRSYGRQKFMTIVNFAQHPNSYNLSRPGKLILSSRNKDHTKSVILNNKVELLKHEAIILQLK